MTPARLALAALLAALALSAAHAQPPKPLTAPVVKGNNVRLVIYNNKDGKFGGAVSKGDGKTWHEDNHDGHFEFTELGRDEWSVYLLKADGAMVQLDLFTKKFYICQGPLSAEEMKDPGQALARKTELYMVARAYR